MNSMTSSREANDTLVSIIIPCYNAMAWIEDAIDSCLRQSYSPIEIIIVDDGSTDKSLHIIENYAALYPEIIHFVSQPNAGAPAARNRGFELSHGSFIQWLDADDLLGPNKLEYQMKALRAPDTDIVTGKWRHLVENQDGSYSEGPLKAPDVSDDPVVSLVDMEGWAPPSSYLMSRSIVEAVGGWDTKLSCLQDVDFLVRLAMTGARFRVIPRLCGYYRRPKCATLSTRDQEAFKRVCFRIYDMVYDYCEKSGWTDERRRILTRCYGWLARYYFESDRAMFEDCMARINTLTPKYVPEGPARLRWLSKLVGYRMAERIALWYRLGKKAFLRNGAHGVAETL